MRDLFDPLFDLQDARLKKLGNPFEERQHLIHWEVFHPEFDSLYKKERKSNAGAKPKEVVMMFKGLVVQNLYGFSDEQLEYQLEDRRSFQRFLGLNKHERFMKFLRRKASLSFSSMHAIFTWLAISQQEKKRFTGIENNFVLKRYFLI
jgi:hypothetical protein